MSGSSKQAPPAAMDPTPAASVDPTPPAQEAVTAAPLSKEEEEKKKVILSQSYVDFVLSCEKTERTRLLDLGFMDRLLARIPGGDSDEYLAEQGFTLEGMKQIAATTDDLIEKYEEEALADLDYYRIREEYERKGYVEMEITDDEEEVEETRAGVGAPRPPPSPGRRRFRRGVGKKAGGGVNKLN